MLADRVREARKRKGLSRYRLSKDAGLDPSHVQLIETGQRTRCSGETLAALAAVLDVTVDWLLGAGPLEPEPAAPTGDAA